jgi:hypothetical protein
LKELMIGTLGVTRELNPQQQTALHSPARKFAKPKPNGLFEPKVKS